MSYFPQVQYFFSTVVVKLCLWHWTCLALSNQPGYFFVYYRTSITCRRNVQIRISSALENWGDQHLFSMFLVPCSSVTPADPLTWAQSDFTDQRREGKWRKNLSHVCKRAASHRRGHSGPSPHLVSFQDILCYDVWCLRLDSKSQQDQSGKRQAAFWNFCIQRLFSIWMIHDCCQFDWGQAQNDRADNWNRNLHFLISSPALPWFHRISII